MPSRFSVIVNDKEYKCYREIEGKRVFRQCITVEGFGSKNDENDYGYNSKYVSVSAMEHFAKVIARELINTKT
jgi:hypothetical protein